MLGSSLHRSNCKKGDFFTKHEEYLRSKSSLTVEWATSKDIRLYRVGTVIGLGCFSYGFPALVGGGQDDC